jgi:hypothetical protein
MAIKVFEISQWRLKIALDQYTKGSKLLIQVTSKNVSLMVDKYGICFEYTVPSHYEGEGFWLAVSQDTVKWLKSEVGKNDKLVKCYYDAHPANSLSFVLYNATVGVKETSISSQAPYDTERFELSTPGAPVKLEYGSLCKAVENVKTENVTEKKPTVVLRLYPDKTTLGRMVGSDVEYLIHGDCAGVKYPGSVRLGMPNAPIYSIHLELSTLNTILKAMQPIALVFDKNVRSNKIIITGNEGCTWYLRY